MTCQFNVIAVAVTEYLVASYWLHTFRRINNINIVCSQSSAYMNQEIETKHVAASDKTQ